MTSVLVLSEYNRTMRQPWKNNRNLSRGNILAKVLLAILLILIAGLAIYGTYNWQHNKVNTLDKQVTSLNTQLNLLKNQIQQPGYTYTSQKGVKIIIYTPLKNSIVASPIAVVGEVPGNWSFEASFPVQLKDSSGNVIVQTPAQVLGSWQTDQLVPFSVKLIYSGEQSGSGTIVLQKDNPSGLASNSDSVIIPIKY